MYSTKGAVRAEEVLEWHISFRKKMTASINFILDEINKVQKQEMDKVKRKGR